MSASSRTAFLVLGTLAFVGAIAVSSGLLTIGLTETAVVLVALLVLGIAFRSVSRRRGVRTRLGTPDPERTVHVAVPGETVSDALSTFRQVSSRHGTVNRRIADSLRDVAVAVLTRFEGDPPEAAKQQLEDGTWTDDQIAAAFLSPDLERPVRSIRDRVGGLLGYGNGSRFQSGVSHAVAEIAAIGYESDTPAGDRTLPTYRFGRQFGREDEPPRRTRADDDPIDGIEPARQIATGYWTGIGVVALAAVGIGALAESPAVVLAGVVGVGYAGFARAFDSPTLELSLERSVSETDPEPGDEVDVTVTITNERGSFVPDLRIVDGVPPGMVVTTGSSRLGTALRPGESATLEYTTVVQRGNHAFDPALVLARDLSQSTEREFFLGADHGETTVVCEPDLRPIATSVPIRATATSFSGRLLTADGGSGTTFHSVREYRSSDPLSRIDWNRRAKTGELTTLEFHEERSARVVVLVDARKSAYVAPTADGTHAVDRSIAAAGRIGATLLEDGHSIGLAGIGPVGSESERRRSDEACWLAPASGRHHELQFRELLATHSQFDASPPDREVPWLTQLRTLRRRLSAETGIVLLSPLCDGGSADVARRLEARGHPVTVVSPDPTADETAGQRLAGVARRVRRFDLERAGIRVVDWPDDEPIDETVARYARSGGGIR
ncbi:DUF58 domain-containing protein [Natronobacterium gregoryi]|uniref:DUF58 domain-containing protein n=2 Tax=Natronobacterium gregoryi TaxID=44930 RepID=L0AKY6_NATGS|nr:DUF58 domain-containing protein [Natronobacterium gregoryi]AFZ73705.1 hypothetical protein Natgr_2548 [Natronobacterium gregoryi SP2]ELY67665.1 hypothetical protein C490_10862 [Natronobacterium gregoryi SP2]PLK19573.1 DUF58 domain-containing protein [Natronobacterium gregoryi SP2]SFJ01609.1 Uncharacterized conserved protein, DUF58 family, contains vWF domain [Natronobacterium gregoryi]